MKAKLRFPKRALILAGLFVGTAGVVLAPSAASARNFIGVDLGPLSVGIGPNEPDYYVAPAPAPVPSTSYVAPAPSTTYVVPAPSTTYVVPAPQTYTAPPVTYYPAPTGTQTTTTTYYNYPTETTTYYGYQPGVVPRASETQTIYYGQ